MSTDYTEFESKMKKTASVLTEQYDSVRAGKANPAVLDRITVDYYGSPTPIQQIASVSTPDARSLLIQPWDASVLKGIEKAILASDLGLNPQNDGRTIRLIFPALTEERRRDLVKQCKTYAEEARVAVRNARRDANTAIEKAVKRDARIRTESAALEQARAAFRRLSAREQEVATGVARGLLNKQIAYELNISEKTVIAHRSSLCKKLGARTAADITRMLMTIDPDAITGAPAPADGE